MSQTMAVNSQVFAKILRYISCKAEEIDMPLLPGNALQVKSLLNEIADAFECDGGFEHTADQALPLAQIFASISSTMRTLSYHATELGSDAAAGKIKWAAARAQQITAGLEEKHLDSSSGIVTLETVNERTIWNDENTGHS